MAIGSVFLAEGVELQSFYGCRQVNFRDYLVPKCVVSNNLQAFRQGYGARLTEIVLGGERVLADFLYRIRNHDIMNVVSGKGPAADLRHGVRNLNFRQVRHVVVLIAATECRIRNFH